MKANFTMIALVLGGALWMMGISYLQSYGYLDASPAFFFSIVLLIYGIKEFEKMRKENEQR